MIVAFTGHRPNKLPGGYGPNPELKEAIKGELQELAPEAVIVGMALGVDQIAAEACIELGIPFVAAIPFKGQEKIWPDASKKKYYELLDKASAAHIVCEGDYSAYKMQVRNEWMIDRCNLLIAVWDGSKGGTGNAVGYALKVDGVEILKLHPKTLAWEKLNGNQTNQDKEADQEGSSKEADQEG